MQDNQQVHAVRVHVHRRSNRVVARFDGRYEGADELLDGRARRNELPQNISVGDAFGHPLLEELLAIITAVGMWRKAICEEGADMGVCSSVGLGT